MNAHKGGAAAIAASDLRQPHGHYDETEGPGSEARVNAAMRSFVMDIGATAALRLDTCVHCGMCAEACPFYLNTGDPRYTPIHKAEPLKQAYKREMGPFAPFFELLGLKRKVTIEELREWEELLFDSCTLCGRCSLICPMGIDIAELIEDARHGMAEAGLVPRQLYEKAARQHETGNTSGLDTGEMVSQLEHIGAEYAIDIPIDKPSAEIMVCTTTEEMTLYPATVAAMVRVLDHVGADYTFSSQVIDASNYGYVSGSLAWQRESILRIAEAVNRCGARLVLMPEDGYAYVALRWEGAELLGRPLPFDVKHISEFMQDRLQAGQLRLQRGDEETVTLHESCQLVRRGGVIEPPLELLTAMGIDFKRTAEHGAFGHCCGGGGGVLENERAEPLRYRVFEAKMREIEQTGSSDVVTTCSVCRRTFDEGVSSFNWDKRIRGLTELVAKHLAD